MEGSDTRRYRIKKHRSLFIVEVEPGAAVLFDKSEYVFDITGGKALSEREKMLDVLEKEENAKSGDDGSDSSRQCCDH